MRRSKNSAAFTLLGCAILIVAASPSRSLATDGDEVIESFPVPGDGDLLVIPVKWNKREYQFIVDTGMTENVFDTSLESTLVPTRMRGQKGDKFFKLFRSPSYFVGQSAIPLVGLGTCRDLSGLRTYSGHAIRGIVGMAFLRTYVLKIDFDERRLSLLKSSDHAAGQRLPINFDQFRRPTLNVRLPGVGDTPFLVDTGLSEFTNGNLTSSAIDALVKARWFTVDQRKTRALTLDGITSYRQGTIQDLAVGGFHHQDQTLTEGIQNALGLGYLSRYEITFDFPQRVAYLQKGRQFNRSFPIDESGLQFVIGDGVVEISDADSDGLGFQAGIRKGDRILEIDGRKPLGMTVYQISAMLNCSPNGMRVKICRPPGISSRELFVRPRQEQREKRE